MPATPGRSRARRSTYTSPPRSLNAPVGVWFSCLTQTSAPHRSASKGHAYCGVPGKLSCTTRNAASSSGSENIRPGAPENVEAIPPGRGNSRVGSPSPGAGSGELQIGGCGLAAFHRDVENNFLSVIQSLQASSLNGSDMHEHVLAAILRHD